MIPSPDSPVRLVDRSSPCRGLFAGRRNPCLERGRSLLHPSLVEMVSAVLNPISHVYHQPVGETTAVQEQPARDWGVAGSIGVVALANLVSIRRIARLSPARFQVRVTLNTNEPALPLGAAPMRSTLAFTTLAVGLLHCSTANALADEYNITPAEHQACDGDAAKICANAQSEDEVLACMKAHRRLLTPVCRSVFEAGLRKRHLLE